MVHIMILKMQKLTKALVIVKTFQCHLNKKKMLFFKKEQRNTNFLACVSTKLYINVNRLVRKFDMK